MGPATTRRGDPIGIFSRDMVWTPVREVLVRPPMVPLDSLGAGLLRDLEGVSTDALSQSDLAFHALREYVPGDDLRHIHWRSSAKVMASGGDSSLLVRQYLDTRRSHAAIVVDDVESSWADPDDFESAMSVAASIAVRAVLDDFDVSFVCGDTASTGTDGHLALDAVCRAEHGRAGIVKSARRATQVASDCSLLFLIGGPDTEFTDMLRGAAAFPPGGASLRDPHRSLGHQPGHRDRRPARAAPRGEGRSRRPPAVEREMTSTAGAPDTVTRSRRSRVRPDLDSSIDLLFVLLLSGLALSGFATSFTGAAFLVVGLIGVILAIGVTHATRALGWPLVAPVVIVALLFFLLGGPLCLRSVGDTAFLPSGSNLGTLVDQAIFGWKDMLTTLPPVDGDGPLLVLPWLLGLLAGLIGTALSAIRLRRAWVSAMLPVLGLTGVLIAVILLGVRHPQSVLVQGSVFAAAALGWLAIRARRASATVHGGTSGWGRAALGAALVLLASGLAMPASALVTGDDDEGRAVVRTWVEPPFDIGRYPSPLAGFRKYIDLRPGSDPANVFEKTMFTVTGAAGRRADPHRHHGRLRRHGLGRHQRCPARAPPTTRSSGSPRPSTTPSRARRSRRR